jgi:hypothetical protein
MNDALWWVLDVGMESDYEGYFDGNPNLDLWVVKWVLCLWKRVKALMGVFVVGFHGWVWFLVK